MGRFSSTVHKFQWQKIKKAQQQYIIIIGLAGQPMLDREAQTKHRASTQHTVTGIIRVPTHPGTSWKVKRVVLESPGIFNCGQMCMCTTCITPNFWLLLAEIK